MSQYVVFGNPITHSLSPRLHQLFAKQCQIEISYGRQHVPIGQFDQTVNLFREQGGLGANITTPFKSNALDYTDQLTERAQLAQAVNTFLFQNNGVCLGDNTDGVGFVRSLKTSLKNKRILIIGAGGAVRGLLGPIIEQQPKSITLTNRTLEKAETLSQDFAKLFAINILSDEKQFDVVINGTRSDFKGDLGLLSHLNLTQSTCYDLNYGDYHRAFLQWTQSQNALSCTDGLAMLIEQGAESFYLWTGKMPETKKIIEQLQK